MTGTDSAHRQIGVVVAARALPALTERFALVQEAVGEEAVPVAANSARDAFERTKGCSSFYLIDVNSVTAPLAGTAIMTKRPFVVDVGDDLRTLTASTRSRWAALVYGEIEKRVFSGATAVIHRGSYHVPLLRSRTGAPLHWAPDSVPDWVLDTEMDVTEERNLVATFGSTPRQRNGDRVYGWEIVDIVASLPTARGLIIANGPGIGQLHERARRRGVEHRVTIVGPVDFRTLVDRLRPASFITSVQSDDPAGWVRTTAKLPLALGLGKVLLATRVGEAARLLPPEFLTPWSRDEEVVRQMCAAVGSGKPKEWPRQARSLAERFRRSTVASELSEFLGKLTPQRFR